MTFPDNGLFNFSPENLLDDVISLFLPGVPRSAFPTTPRAVEKDSLVEFSFALPGVPKENIQVIAKQDHLTVSTIDADGQKAQKLYEVDFNQPLNIKEAVADAKDGILTVQIPFSEDRDGVLVKFGELAKETVSTEKDAPASAE